MPAVVGVFKARADAEHAVAELKEIGVPNDRINLLTPEAGEKELAAVPQSQGEQPGMVKTLGALTGGALGAGIGEMVATMILPGAGLVIALGLAGGALLGAIGGEEIGRAAENTIFSSLPEEELFVYEDALRRGRSVVIATLTEDGLAEAVRGAFDHNGAESVDRAREMWWIGLRDVEKEHYEAKGRSFDEDEDYVRAGFEAALLPINRDKSYDQARESLRAGIRKCTTANLSSTAMSAARPIAALRSRAEAPAASPEGCAPWSRGRLRLAARGDRGAPLHLLRRDVFLMRGNRPLVAERVV
jgi:hypothetical protein